MRIQKKAVFQTSSQENHFFCGYTLRLKAALDSPFLLVMMSAYCPASAVVHSITSRHTLFPEAVIRCFIACSFTSFPSFIQATVAGGAFKVASNEAAAPRATVKEPGKAVKIGA